MNINEAMNIVLAELDRNKDPVNPIDCVVLENKTIEKPWGWVFFYQSEEFIKSGDFRDMLAGNAPIIVNRHTGDLVYTGTAHVIEYYICEYEASL